MAIIKSIDTTTFVPQEYSLGEENSLPVITVDPTFNPPYGRVEILIYDLNGNQLWYDPNSTYAASTPGSGENYISAVSINPEEALTKIGLSEGSYNVVYNFLNNELKSSYNQPFRIKEISANRKELRLTTGWLEEDELRDEIEKFFPSTIESLYYPDFQLNFGNGNIYTATNMLFDNTNNQYSVLIKLYKPLPAFIQADGVLNPWIVTKQRESVGYNIEFEQKIIKVKTTQDIKGPNFSLDINNQVHTTVKPTSLEDLESGENNSYYQLQRTLNQKGVDINIDYTDFNNFIHFSSAEQRVRNFYYKVGLIEDLKTELVTQSYAPSTGDDNVNTKGYQVTKGKIQNIISNFDGFENWMYYTSQSINSPYPKPYPKTNSTTPYTLVSTGSAEALAWLEVFTTSASLYDLENQDNLINTIPDYIVEDSDNEPYLKFVEMIGQHFDTLFTYAQDITNRYDGDNRLDFGISKDLVGEAIKSMGINLYAGNFSAKDLYSSFTSEFGYIPPQEDGNTKVTNYVTSSAASGSLPSIEDVNKEIYKRIYHNLPLLVKQKGSIAGLRTLVNCFGVPNEILNVKEFNIDYSYVSQSLPSVESEGQIQFTTQSGYSLPPTGSDSPPSNLLSPSVRIQQHYLVSSSTYDRSLQYMEVGFSPQTYLDGTSEPAKPLNNFYDFETFYFGDNTSNYGDEEGTGDWSTGAYMRYIKFFDTSLFQMIKDFTPVRSSVATGFTWKPRLNDTRNRYRPAQLTFENLSYSGSGVTKYYSYDAFLDKYGIERESGSILRTIGDIGNKHLTSSFPAGTGGTFDDYNLIRFTGNATEAANVFDDRAKLKTPISGVIQQWDDVYYGSSGSTYTINHNDQSEFYNGEFKQSGLNNLTQKWNAGVTSGYFEKEAPYFKDSFVAGQGSGYFAHNNNPTNLYKLPVPDSSKYSLIKVNMNNQASLASATQNMVYYKTTGVWSFQIIYINTSVVPKNTLLANGNSLNIAFSVPGSPITSSIPVSDGFVQVMGGSGEEYVGFFCVGFTGDLEYKFYTYGSNVTYYPSSVDPGTFKILQPWVYSDFNPLTGNSFDPAAGQDDYAGIRKGSRFMDADYSPGGTDPYSPINLELLASGSASRAAVPDSNFTSKWWSKSRYEGVRNSSPDFNQRIIQTAYQTAELFTKEALGYDPEYSASNPIGPVVPDR